MERKTNSETAIMHMHTKDATKTARGGDEITVCISGGLKDAKCDDKSVRRSEMREESVQERFARQATESQLEMHSMLKDLIERRAKSKIIQERHFYEEMYRQVVYDYRQVVYDHRNSFSALMHERNVPLTECQQWTECH